MDNIFILRHGIAEDPSLDQKDSDRKLTPEGIKKTKRLSEFFNASGEQLDLIIHSPYVRTTQTAEIFLEGLDQKPEIKIGEFLASGASSREIAKGLIPCNGLKNVLIVGHAPDLGFFIGELIDADGIRMKKGALAKVVLENSIELAGELEYLVTSKVVRAIN